MTQKVNMMVKVFLAAVESSYDDSTYAALDGDNAIPAAKDGSELTWAPQVDELPLAMGGFGGNAGAFVGDKISGTLKAPVRPLTVSSAMTERPDIHPLLIASGYEAAAKDESLKVNQWVADGDGTTNSFNASLNGASPIYAVDVTITATIGGVAKTATFNSVTGAAGGDASGGTLNFSNGALSSLAWTAGAPDSGTPLLANFQQAETVIQRIGTGDGTTTPTMTSSALRPKVNPDSVTIVCDAQSGSDDGTDGSLDQGDLATGATLNFVTGVITGALTYDNNTTNNAPVIATYTAAKLGPYTIRYTLAKHPEGSMALKMLARASNGSAHVVTASGVRGKPGIEATRRKHVVFSTEFEGLFKAWGKEATFPTSLAPLDAPVALANFQAVADIDLHGVIANAEDTGQNSASSGTTALTGTLDHPPTEGTLRIYVNSSGKEAWTDPTGSGTLSGNKGGTGTINYTTGAFSITPGTAVGVVADVLADYEYDLAVTSVFQDFKLNNDAYELEASETGSGTAGYDEIVMTAGQPSAELTVRFDGDLLDWRQVVVSQAAVSSSLTWTDARDKRNTVEVQQAHRATSEGLEITGEARGDLIIKGPLLWGLSGYEGESDRQYGIDPSKEVHVLIFRTDPSLGAGA